MSDELYLQKYLKYKNKYLELQQIAQGRMRNQRGGKLLSIPSNAKFILLTCQMTPNVIEKLEELLEADSHTYAIWAVPNFNVLLINGEITFNKGKYSELVKKLIENNVISIKKIVKETVGETVKETVKEKTENEILSEAREIQNKTRKTLRQSKNVLERTLLVDQPYYGVNAYLTYKRVFGDDNVCNIDSFGCKKIFEDYVFYVTVDHLTQLNTGINNNIPKALNVVHLLQTTLATLILIKKLNNNNNNNKFKGDINDEAKIGAALTNIFNGTGLDKGVDDIIISFLDLIKKDLSYTISDDKKPELIKLFDKIKVLPDDIKYVLNGVIPEDTNGLTNLFKQLIIIHHNFKSPNKLTHAKQKAINKYQQFINGHDLNEQEYLKALICSNDKLLEEDYSLIPDQKQTTRNIGKLYTTLKPSEALSDLAFMMTVLFNAKFNLYQDYGIKINEQTNGIVPQKLDDSLLFDFLADTDNNLNTKVPNFTKLLKDGETDDICAFVLWLKSSHNTNRDLFIQHKIQNHETFRYYRQTHSYTQSIEDPFTLNDDGKKFKHENDNNELSKAYDKIYAAIKKDGTLLNTILKKFGLITNPVLASNPVLVSDDFYIMGN